MALLDLQACIADELKPDYLLIDARTGVTELGSLATTILADTVVCMFVANRESLDGTLKVIGALKSARRLASQKPIRIVPVLSRTDATDTFASAVARFLKLDDTLYTLPHDKLDASERLSASSPLYRAYLELFLGLFPSAELAKAHHFATVQPTPRKNL